MDKEKKEVYLERIAGLVSKTDEKVFSERVTKEKNAVYELILKYTNDSELAEQVRPIIDKNELLDFLNKKIGEMKESRCKNIDFLRRLEPEQYFILENKNKIGNLRELIEALKSMDDGVFGHYVTQHKNDFSAWIYHSLGDSVLSENLKEVKDKKQMIEIIEARFKSISGKEILERIDEFVSMGIELSKKGDAKGALEIYKTVKNAYAECDDAVKPVVYKKALLLAESLKKEKAGSIQSGQKIEIAKPLQETKSNAPLSVVDAQFSSMGKKSNILEISSEGTKQGKEKLAISAKQVFNQIDILNTPIKEILVKLNIVDYSSPFIAVEEEINVEKKERERIMTGVIGFDNMITEGIPKGSSILVSGGPGSGKTTFCIQMLGWAAERDEKCLFMTFEESDEQLIEHMESYGLNPKSYMEKGNLMIVRQDPFRISRTVEALLAHGRGELLIDINEILNILPEGYKPDRVVIDSLSAIASTFADSDTAYRIYVDQLINLLKKSGATSFLISEVQGIENIGHGLVEEFLADGVIVFYNLQKGNLKQSALEILKMRAVNHEKKIVPFEFVKGKGIVVYPLEKIFL